MKEKLMKEIQQAMNGKLSDRQKEQLVTAINQCREAISQCHVCTLQVRSIAYEVVTGVGCF